jgi:hypothetical protein
MDENTTALARAAELSTEADTRAAFTLCVVILEALSEHDASLAEKFDRRLGEMIDMLDATLRPANDGVNGEDLLLATLMSVKTSVFGRA